MFSIQEKDENIFIKGKLYCLPTSICLSSKLLILMRDTNV